MAGTRSGAGGAGGTRGVGRLVAMVLALVVVAFLLLAGQARAGLYTVAQCGWGVGANLDPTFAPTIGPAFSVDASACPTPPGSGPTGMALEGAIAADGLT